MPTLNFTVDAALLRELGERLVGQPHIALAELVKNSYDADAAKVEIVFEPDRIEVRDNGHGMTKKEFRDYWMRIGSPHKGTQRVSRRLHRPMTGSKGIGRLAVQFLGGTLSVVTAADSKTNQELVGHVDWNEAVHSGDLTEAEVRYRQRARREAFPEDAQHGTVIVISKLNDEWQSRSVGKLAKAIWPLQPPFRPNPHLKDENQKAFSVEVVTADQKSVKEFHNQMGAILNIWDARVVGKLRKAGTGKGKGAVRRVRLVLEFSDGTTFKSEYGVDKCKLHFAEFEIRIYKFQGKQPFGIKVKQARDYLNVHGGVHVYDGGFHLPYYGVDADWLDIEMDHSHRLSKSKLLPDKLHVPEGMTFLPTQSRIFGVVHVDTGKELSWARRAGTEHKQRYLKIQITRDRLAENVSYENLHFAVRYALDYYAITEARRRAREIMVEPVPPKIQRIDMIVERYKNEIPTEVFRKLTKQIKRALDASEQESAQILQNARMLGTLATAGISSLAYDHELNRQFHSLENVIQRLRSMAASSRKTRTVLGDELEDWLERAKATRALFSHLTEEENRTETASYKAKKLVKQVKTQLKILTRGIDIDISGIESDLRLPKGTFAEWSAVFQNIFVNATNAMLDTKKMKIAVSSRRRGRTRALFIQDTGRGVDLAASEELFEPFVRRMAISRERKALGLGGAGMGLPIVRMIADSMNCRVKFVDPEEGYRTALRISWTEKQ